MQLPISGSYLFWWGGGTFLSIFKKFNLIFQNGPVLLKRIPFFIKLSILPYLNVNINVLKM